MTIYWNETKQIISEAFREQHDGDLHRGVRGIDKLEGGIAFMFNLVDEWAERAVVEHMYRLRWHERKGRAWSVGVGVGKEFGKHDDGVEQENQDATGDREAMSPKAAPGESPLARRREALCSRRRGAVCSDGFARAHRDPPSRMRGSITISSRSDSNVPTTVRMPSISTIVPARNRSCATRDR